MIRKSSIACALLATLALSPAHAQKSSGERLDDTGIATTIKAALIGDKAVSSTSINVEVYKGTAQLGGFVDSDAERSAAIATAKGVDGVTKVLDAMVVSPGKRSMGTTIDDQATQVRLKSALVDSEGMEKGFDINTEVRNGEVLLTGFVSAEKYRKAAGDTAAAVKGVSKVHNKIAIK